MDVYVWSVEFVKGLGAFFINPMLYWAIIIVIIAGRRRINRERKQFGFKVFPMFYEMKHVWCPAIVFGIILSLLFLGIGFVFTYPTIILLSILVIFVSLLARFTFLSASYTVTLTYFAIVFSPIVLKYQSFVDPDIFLQDSLTSIAILLGLLLTAEAFLLKSIRRNETFPELIRSKRGRWIGRHRLSKVAIVPFFILVPSGLITPYLSFWPYFSVGDETYSLFLLPFLLGFDIPVQHSLPTSIIPRLANVIALLGLVIILLGVGSIYFPILHLLAILIAILGREYIIYKHNVREEQKSGFFTPIPDGLRVLSIIPDTPGAKLGILVGEMITKVNGIPVQTVNEFYEALQASGAYFKLDVIDDTGEIRYVQSPFYAGDHHKLGLIFTDIPYDERRMSSAED